MSTKNASLGKTSVSCLHNQGGGVVSLIARKKIMDIIHYVHLPARQHRSYSFLAIRLMRVACKGHALTRGNLSTSARANGPRGGIDSLMPVTDRVVRRLEQTGPDVRFVNCLRDQVRELVPTGSNEKQETRLIPTMLFCDDK